MDTVLVEGVHRSGREREESEEPEDLRGAPRARDHGTSGQGADSLAQSVVNPAHHSVQSGEQALQETFLNTLSFTMMHLVRAALYVVKKPKGLKPAQCSTLY